MSTNKTLLTNLQNALSSDKQRFIQICSDFQKTFTSLGVSRQEAPLFTMQVINFIASAKTIEEAEKNAKQLFLTKKFHDKTVFQMIEDGLQERFEIIFNQISPHLQGADNILDFGCGSGTLTQMIHDRCGVDIEGVDVRDFRGSGVTIPIHVFDGYTVPVPDNHFDSAILTNVLHHEADNERILKELNRIVSRKLIIIETVPEGDSKEEADKDWGRMLLNDALWNRFFNYADIPVPGTYERPVEWIRRITKYFPLCTYSEDFGFDQKTIQDRHHGFVFEK